MHRVLAGNELWSYVEHGRRTTCRPLSQELVAELTLHSKSVRYPKHGKHFNESNFLFKSKF